MSDPKFSTEPLCPRCGEPVTDSPEMDFDDGPDAQTMDCANCGETVDVTVRSVRRYATVKAEATDD